MHNNFLKLTGRNKGQTSTILVGVHGNEKCGIEALDALLPTLKIENGTVFVGYGNPLAIKKNVRQVEANLNRMFKLKSALKKQEIISYEYKRAQYIKKHLDRSEALLDVHASSTPKSKPFVICEKNAFEISKYLPIKIVVSGFDKNQPGGTDYYMNQKGKIGICIECGYINDIRSKQIAKNSILAFLALRGHVKGQTKKQNQLFIGIYKLYTTKTSQFTLVKKFKDFENIIKNQIIGYDGNKAISSPKDGIILFARNRNEKGEEAFLLGKKIA